MRGRLTGISLNRDGSENLTVTAASAGLGEIFDRLKDEEVEIEIRKATKHRSLQANAYAWVLIDRISQATRIPKSEIYRHAIREIGGVSQWMTMRAEAVDVFRRVWEAQGLGNQAEVASVDQNTGWAEVIVWFGSSTYDSRQMAALLDSLIQDAEALGIPTITPQEEEKMLGKWAEKKEKEGMKHGNHDDGGEYHAGESA